MKQHFLNFLPLPQGQGSFRPTRGNGFLARCIGVGSTLTGLMNAISWEPSQKRSRIRRTCSSVRNSPVLVSIVSPLSKSTIYDRL